PPRAPDPSPTRRSSDLRARGGPAARGDRARGRRVAGRAGGVRYRLPPRRGADAAAGPRPGPQHRRRREPALRRLDDLPYPTLLRSEEHTSELQSPYDLV